MPTLGEPVEPSRAEAVIPWWRAAAAPSNARETPPKEPALPDGASGDDPVPWPVD